jgi:xanthine dehydrogenase accessory factor
MQSLDLSVLHDALKWYQAGHAVTLFTVVQTWGSAPRPAGALLAVRADGILSGSVSGGCVEDDLVARVKSNGTSVPDPPGVITYGVTQAEAVRFGLPCGGTLRLLQESLLDSTWVAQVLARTAAHELVERTLILASGAVMLERALPGQTLQFDGVTLRTVFGPQWRLLLIGAGQLSQAVARIASLLDFEVLVCDPREEYATTLEAGLPSLRRIEGMPDDVVRALVPDARMAIVALTHDPKLDDMALIEALQSSAFYVGALGSQRNQDARKKRLAEHFDLSHEALTRLHGPVGLALGAKTPAEIAISIVAQIVQIRNQAGAAVHRTAGCAPN